ncbi:hypothetical protein SAMN05421805_13322 [Saccharopolyspora antimicrobica]|uniref:Uncharacterized protein n=1 Tax=Saccharopolyspora antimicrobica TaxID=455193 RepID=A0A1I5LTU4_9PSEU|nr:hypothetical protein [Saccharopolyspora antimicrobica]RKT87342.1 hypothetical protein ATL45_5754 [Saccharopolyspora antimicrobica]SFP00662.1 hypothetical protein SAMN05421805_13322 [Saccharopolyspora antimicrobica]
MVRTGEENVEEGAISILHATGVRGREAGEGPQTSGDCAREHQLEPFVPPRVTRNPVTAGRACPLLSRHQLNQPKIINGDRLVRVGCQDTVQMNRGIDLELAAADCMIVRVWGTKKRPTASVQMTCDPKGYGPS